MRPSTFFLLVLVPLGGCASKQLQVSTLNQAKTVTEIQYQQTLNNIAAFCLNPDTLPSSVVVKNGSTQVADTGSLGFLGIAGIDTKFGSSPTVSSSRSIVDQWGVAPVTDDNALTILRMAYQNALGIPARLTENQANDMAHDLSVQVGTNADISVDSDTLRTVIRIVREKSEVPSITPLPKSDPVPGAARGNADGSQIAGRSGQTKPRDSLTAAQEAAEVELRQEAKKNETSPGLLKNKEVLTDSSDQIARSFEDVSSKITDTLDETFMVKDPNKPSHFVPAILDTETGKRPATGLAKETIRRMNDIQDTLERVPSQWFQVSYRNKHEKHFEPPIPKDLCYKGFATSCGRECCVWVCTQNLPQLSEFTLQILHLSSVFKDSQIVNVPSGIQFSPALSNPSR